MKRIPATIALVAVLAVAVMSLAAGCGGGGEEATSPAGGAAGESSGGGTAADGGAPPAPVATATAQNTDEVTKPVQFVANSETPTSFAQALKKKKPMCVEFYLPSDPVTADVAREMKVIRKEFGKQFVFLRYNVNDADETAAISAQLKVGYETYFVLIDKNQYIVYRHPGYVDRLTLSQAMFSTLRR